jgi:hypothetical protein
MTFDRGRFDELLDLIQRDLGRLRGAELAWDYLAQFPITAEGGGTYPVTLSPGYELPIADHAFRPRTDVLLLVPAEDVLRPQLAAYPAQVETELRTLLDEGERWASELAAYCRRVCEPFCEPDAQVVTQTVLDIQSDVVATLAEEPAAQGWAQLSGVFAQMDGGSASAFVDFHGDFDEVQARYGLWVGQVCTGFAMFAALTNTAQLGALAFLEKVHKLVSKRLDAWQSAKGEPGGLGDTSVPVADLRGALSAALDDVDHVPTRREAGALSGEVPDLSGQVRSIVAKVQKTGSSAYHERWTGIDADTATGIYQAVTDTLATDHLLLWQKCVEAIDTGKYGEVLPHRGGRESGVPQFSAAQQLQNIRQAEDGWRQTAGRGDKGAAFVSAGTGSGGGGGGGGRGGKGGQWHEQGGREFHVVDSEFHEGRPNVAFQQEHGQYHVVQDAEWHEGRRPPRVEPLP